MSIASTAQDIYLARFLKDTLQSGRIPSFREVSLAIKEFKESSSFDQPSFLATNFQVHSREPSSAEKNRQMILAALNDFSVLYQELKSLADLSLSQHERWSMDFQAIENTIQDLESRVNNLLLLAKDADGYINFVADYLRDLSLVDQSLSNVFVDISSHIAMLDPSSSALVPLALQVGEKDISFRVVSRTGNVVGASSGQDLLNIVSDRDLSWTTQVQTTEKEPLTGELRIRLGDSAVSFTRIEFVAEASNTASAMQVTPLYSLDGFNYSQLPGRDITMSVVDRGVFVFSAIEAQHVKFLITKPSPDFLATNKYAYEFGIKSIHFFDAGYAITGDEPPCLISKPLSVLDLEGEVVPFSKLTLETCEYIPEGTDIRYSVAVSNDSTLPVTTTTQWFPISPANRRTKEDSSIIDVGDLSLVELGDDEDLEPVSISYNSLAAEDWARSPSSTFHILGLDVNGNIQDTLQATTKSRYTLLREGDRLLSYQLKVPQSGRSAPDATYFLIDESSLSVYRNVGAQGLIATDLTSKVRGVQRGWKFLDPYYYCLVKVVNPDGLKIDVGQNSLWVNDIARSGSIVLPAGESRIRIHKNNWFYVSPEKSSLADLMESDLLYPYNHKLLIEGYLYADDFDSPSEKIYRGVDLFAETKMQKVKIFEYLNKVKDGDFDKFAVDYDLINSYSNDYPSLVFVVKVNEEISDAINERFLISFKMVDSKYKYLRLRAEFETSDSDLTPVLMSYKIKLG